MLKTTRVLDRLARKSTEQACLDLETDCWVWSGQTTEGGYGRFSYEGRIRATHRVAYELLRAPLDGLHIDHLCRVRSCWNPWHMDPVTNQVNFWRGRGPLHQAAKTHCKFGHPYDEQNTYLRDGHRTCRKCRSARSAAYDAANREKRAAAARARRGRG